MEKLKRRSQKLKAQKLSRVSEDLQRSVIKTWTRAYTFEMKHVEDYPVSTLKIIANELKAL